VREWGKKGKGGEQGFIISRSLERKGEKGKVGKKKEEEWSCPKEKTPTLFTFK